MALGDPGEDLVQGVLATHVLDLLEDHRRQLPVALGEDGVGPLGYGEKEGGAAPGTPLGVADHKGVALEVGEVLAHRVWGDPEVGSDRLGAGWAFAPEVFQDLHAGRTAGDHRGTHPGWAGA